MVGRLKAANDIHEQRNIRMPRCRRLAQSFNNSEFDPLAAADDLDGLGTSLKSREVQDQEILRVKSLLASRTFTDVVRDAPPDIPTFQFKFTSEEFAPDENLDEELSTKKKASKVKQQVWNRGRSEVLGDYHKQTRILLRAELEPGYYISYSGKRRIKVLHRLGQCYMLPGVDYTTYEYLGAALPDSFSNDTVCKWCARSKDFHTNQNSSCTNTSPSSEEDET